MYLHKSRGRSLPGLKSVLPIVIKIYSSVKRNLKRGAPVHFLRRFLIVSFLILLTRTLFRLSAPIIS